jgi:hypothetical protein
MCVCVFQCNFIFGRDSFQMDNFPRVSTLKHIDIFISLLKCYMLHPIFYYTLENAEGIVSSTDHKGSLLLNLTRPLLTHISQPNTLELSGIILYFL